MSRSKYVHSEHTNWIWIMIKEFQGEYRWLSNFMPCEIYYDGIEYRSVEHAYMSAKCDDKDWKLICQHTESPGHVKRQSRKIKLRPDWEYVKKGIMLECLLQKYAQEPYKSNLLATGDVYIQEGNTWGDKFWGVDLRTGHGQNNLGLMIMNIRTDLQSKVDSVSSAKQLTPADVTKAAEAGNNAFAYYMKHGKLPE